MTYYHVTAKWDGGDLLSLSERIGSIEEAVEEFNHRWPEGDDNYEFAAHHVQYIHLHDNIASAKEFQREFGGEILVVDLGDDYDVVLDKLEYEHPMVRYRISSDCVSRI